MKQTTATTEEKQERIARRAPDGIVYVRVAKRQNTKGGKWDTGGEILYHWCANETPDLWTPDTPEHICDIWSVAADQEQDLEPAVPVTGDIYTTDELIRRVSFTEEALSTEPVPLLLRTAVLALLQQAKALEQIITLLEDWKRRTPRGIRVRIERPPADPTSPNEQR